MYEESAKRCNRCRIFQGRNPMLKKYKDGEWYCNYCIDILDNEEKCDRCQKLLICYNYNEKHYCGYCLECFILKDNDQKAAIISKLKDEVCFLIYNIYY